MSSKLKHAVTHLYSENSMAKIKIFKKDGTATPYFWSKKDSVDGKLQTVFKQTAEGIKRMKGVQFDAVNNRMVKH